MDKPKAVLATFGSYGDIHPFIALALELQTVGVHPVIATTEAYRAKIEAEGLAFHAVAPTPAQIENDLGMDAPTAATAVTRRSVDFILRAFVLPYLRVAIDDLTVACADADIVVFSSFAIAAQTAAEALGKPTLCVTLSPIVMMSAEDPPVLEQAPMLPAARRLFGPGVARFAYNQGRKRLAPMNTEVENQRRRLGLPPGQGDALVDGPYRADEVVALYSPLLGGMRATPPKPTHVAGFAFFDRDAPEGETLHEAAEAFLRAGDAPLVFTLGSFAVLAADRFFDHAVKASRALGRRALILVGRDAESEVRARLQAEHVLVLGYAPHSLLFPRACAVIHHGGVGTTGQALRAGRPQLVCPIFGDQPDNAARIRRLGVGVALPYRRFDARRAARALRPLLEEDRFGIRATEVAEVVGREAGARWLAEHIADRFAVTKDQPLS